MGLEQVVVNKILKAHQGIKYLEFQCECHNAFVGTVDVHNLVEGSNVGKTCTVLGVQQQDDVFLKTKFY